MIQSRAVVGAYAGDYGFPLPNPVSIHREYPRSRFRIGWCMQTLQKMKILGVECSGIRDAEYDSTPRVLEGWWYGWRFIQSATLMATCTFVTCTGSTTGGSGALTGSTATGSTSTLLRCVQISSLLAPLLAGRHKATGPEAGGRLLGELTIPPTEHSADLVYLF